MSGLTNAEREALDYLVDMARGHDYAEVAKISDAEDVLLDAFGAREQAAAARAWDECLAATFEPGPTRNPYQDREGWMRR